MLSLVLTSVLAFGLEVSGPATDASSAASLGTDFSLGLDEPTCSEAGCQAFDGTFGLGVGVANFGGFGVGLDGDARLLSAWPSKLGLKLELSGFGHFDGVGPNFPRDRPPQGELGASGELGFGLLTPAGMHDRLRPFVMLNPVGFRGGTFDGADLWAYLPTIELGLLAHARTRDTFLAELAGGANVFWADGPLSRLGSGGGLSHTAVDPYAAAELIADLALSSRNTLRLLAQAGFSPDDLGAFGTRDLWWGRTTLFVKLGPLVSGPQLTWMVPGRQPLGSGYVGAPPETSFLWVIGL